MPQTTEFKILQTEIPGLLEINVDLIEDERGFFQEKFQKAKLAAAGFPADFEIVQQNISYNKEIGVTRGLHAEPWDKYISVIKGKIFAVWVDLRKENFGKVYATTMDQNKTFFVPRGVANAYQTQEPDVYYCYLVNNHWKPDGKYLSVNVADPKLGISWPIGLDAAIISDKDKNNPTLDSLLPFDK